MAMAIMTRWHMPPESWCGKPQPPLAGSGMPTCSSSDQRRVARPALRSPCLSVHLQRLADLEADGEAGIEAGHRVLEDHRHVRRQLAARLGRQVQQILPSKACGRR
jgi:hypothetical protein